MIRSSDFRTLGHSILKNETWVFKDPYDPYALCPDKVSVEYFKHVAETDIETPF